MYNSSMLIEQNLNADWSQISFLF